MRYSNYKSTYKTLIAFIIGVVFILIGIHIITKAENSSHPIIRLIIGYSNIIFWSVLLFLSSFVMIKEKQ